MNDTLVIFSSPRKNGVCKRLLDGYLEKENITEYYLFDCYDRLPSPCIDCGFCKESFACSNRDLDDFYLALERCSRLIIASPVYNAGFPSPLKSVIDRLQIYFCARFARGMKPPIKQPKKIDLLLCSGADKDQSDNILACLRPALTVINARLERLVQVIGTDSGDNDKKIKTALDNI